MASRVGLIMSQVRGQLSQIYREEPQDGGMLTDIVAGVKGGQVVYEGMKAVGNVKKQFRDEYMKGKFHDQAGAGDSLLSRVGERMFGEYNVDTSTEYFKNKRLKAFEAKDPDMVKLYNPETKVYDKINIAPPKEELPDNKVNIYLNDGEVQNKVTNDFIITITKPS